MLQKLTKKEKKRKRKPLDVGNTDNLDSKLSSSPYKFKRFSLIHKKARKIDDKKTSEIQTENENNQK